jgi:hypothetical protein
VSSSTNGRTESSTYYYRLHLLTLFLTPPQFGELCTTSLGSAITFLIFRFRRAATLVTISLSYTTLIRSAVHSFQSEPEISKQLSQVLPRYLRLSVSDREGDPRVARGPRKPRILGD